MRNRIKELMRERGLSRDEVAEAVDAHPITISKLISGKTPLSSAWLEKFSRLFEVPPEQIIAAAPSVRIVKVRAFVQAGHWAESNDWPQDEWYDVAIPQDAALANMSLFGAETRGPSMNKRYPERTVLVHTSQVETGEGLAIGKRYIVERERPDGTRETTVKTLSRDEDGKLWLVPESTDPRFQTAIPLDEDLDAVVRVVGRVLFSVQREE